MIIGRNLIDYTIEDVSTEDSNWLAANLLLFEKRVRYWKTTGTGDSYVVIDLGSAQALKGVGAIDCNYASCKIQGNASDSWGSPSFDTDTVSISQDKLTGLYRLHLDTTDLSGFNYRYLRLFIPTQATTDNDSVFRTGVLAVSVDSDEYVLTVDASGITMRRNQAISLATLHGGGEEKNINGAPYASMSFDIGRLRNASEFALIERLLAIGETELVMFSPDDEMIEDTNNGQYVFIMRKETPPEFLQGQGLDTMSVDLKETI